MISIKPALTASCRTVATLLLIPALALAACGGADEADDEASAGDDTAPASQGEAPGSEDEPGDEEPAAPQDDPAEADAPADGDDSSDTDESTDADDGEHGGSGGSFCDQYAEFLDAWAADELKPVDLTAEYEALATSAPDELVEPLTILAEGNEAALAGGSVPEGYDAAGETMAVYARDKCGIAMPGL